MAVGGGSRDHGELAQPGLESGVGLMLPEPEGDPPGLRPSPEAAATAAPEPACTTVPISARQLSSASGVPAGRARGVSPRAVTHRSAPIPRTPAPRYRGSGITVAGRDCQHPGGDHRASLTGCWQRREAPQAMAGTWPHNAPMVAG